MIFILGGGGFVGSAYARLFEKTGVKFEIINRANYADYVGAECDLLINANGNSKKYLGVDDPKREFRESVVSVRDSLVDFRFRKYVFLSTSDVYPDCSSPDLTKEDLVPNCAAQSTYGFHKWIAEMCVRHGAASWLIIRQGGFIGPGLKKNAVYDVLHGGKIWVHPESRFQYISTDDSARLVMELIGKGIEAEIINLTATGTISVAEIMALAGRELVYDGSSPPLHYEISTEKAEKWLSLPKTVETVMNYIHAGYSG